LKIYSRLYHYALCRWKILMVALIAATFSIYPPAWGEETANETINVEQALICETIQDLQPVHPAIAFSIKIGRVSCYTEFSNISRETLIFHRWYRRNSLVTEKKLVLKPPQWSTYSSIQLRESDKGPWRVDIVDARDRTLKTLRFSVTE